MLLRPDKTNKNNFRYLKIIKCQYSDCMITFITIKYIDKILVQIFYFMFSIQYLILMSFLR